jgi:ketosteroid isomerase-like protein
MEQLDIQLSERASTLIGKVFHASETRDVDAFMALVADDIELRLGSQTPVHGKTAVRRVIAVVLYSMKSVEHRLVEAWERGNKMAFQGMATGVTLDGKRVRIPYVDVVEWEGDLIKCYWVNLDASPMMVRPGLIAAAGLIGLGALGAWALINRRRS